MLTRGLLLIVVSLIVPAWACTDEPARAVVIDRADPTSAAGAAENGGVSVQFVPADLPRLAEPEAADPWAERTFGPSTWQVYRVQGDGAPELLYETHRYIYDVAWSEDGSTVSAGFTSGLAGPSAMNDNPTAGRPAGAVFFDIASMAMGQRELLPPRGGYVWPSPVDGRAVVSTSRLLCDPNVATACVVADPVHAHVRQVYLVSSDGAAARLDGLGDSVSFVGWAPDGNALLVHAFSPPAPIQQGVYLVPVAGGTARLVTPEYAYAHDVAWSPDGSRIALVAGSELRVMNRRSGASRQVTAGARYGVGVRPAWSRDGSVILVADRQRVDLIDAATETLLAAVPADGLVGSPALSHDGRRLAMAVALDETEGPRVCPGVLAPYRLVVHDRVAAQVWTVRECGSWYLNGLEWLPDGRRMVVVDARPGRHEGVERSAALLDVDGGRETPLTAGLEQHGWAHVSPDGDRVLARGHAVRVVAADGAQVRETAVPDGLDVCAAAWSPDGQGFVYVVGPRGFFVL